MYKRGKGINIRKSHPGSKMRGRPDAAIPGFALRTQAFRLPHRFKGLAVGALILCRIFLMSTNLNLAQCAVFPIIAMVFTGIYGTFDAVVSVAPVHNSPPDLFLFSILLFHPAKIIYEEIFKIKV